MTAVKPCRAMKESQSSAPGYQRLRMAQYDELRKKLVSSHGGKLGRGEVGQAWQSAVVPDPASLVLAAVNLASQASP